MYPLPLILLESGVENGISAVFLERGGQNHAKIVVKRYQMSVKDRVVCGRETQPVRWKKTRFLVLGPSDYVARPQCLNDGQSGQTANSPIIAYHHLPKEPLILTLFDLPDHFFPLS